MLSNLVNDVPPRLPPVKLIYITKVDRASLACRHWAWGWGNNGAQDFIRKGQICEGKTDEGNTQISQKK